MEWIKEYNIYLQGIILSLIIVGLLTFVLSIFYIFKIKIKKQNLRYVYAFSSGFLLITAIVGQWIVARSKFMHYWSYVNSGSDPSIGQTLLMIVIILLGIFVGSLLAYVIKKTSSLEDHNHDSYFEDHQSHSHLFDTPIETEYESKVNKKSSIVYMILTHKLPAGLIIGILLVNFNSGSEFAFSSLLAFIIHIIPELIIIYYVKIEHGYSRRKSFLFSIMVKILMVLFIFLGIVISNYVNIEGSMTYWIIPFMLSITGMVMIWGSIFELGPVFIHATEDKQAYRLIFTFILGLSLSMAIQMIHVH